MTLSGSISDKTSNSAQTISSSVPQVHDISGLDALVATALKRGRGYRTVPRIYVPGTQVPELWVAGLSKRFLSQTVWSIPGICLPWYDFGTAKLLGLRGTRVPWFRIYSDNISYFLRYLSQSKAHIWAYERISKFFNISDLFLKYPRSDLNILLLKREWPSVECSQFPIK